MTDTPEERFWWIVLFRDTSKPYTYIRSIPEMTEILKEHKRKNGVYPHRVWAVVKGEVQKVEITD